VTTVRSNRLTRRIALPAPTPPDLRGRVRRSETPAGSMLTAPALGQLRRGWLAGIAAIKLKAAAPGLCPAYSPVPAHVLTESGRMCSRGAVDKLLKVRRHEDAQF